MATNHFLGVRIPHGVQSQTKTCSQCEHKEKRKLMQCRGSFSILSTKFGKNIATKLCLMKPRILLGASSNVNRCKFISILIMYSLKDYPEDYSQSESKQWRKFKKALKKLAHKQLRRGNDKYVYHGKEIAW